MKYIFSSWKKDNNRRISYIRDRESNLSIEKNLEINNLENIESKNIEIIEKNESKNDKFNYFYNKLNDEFINEQIKDNINKKKDYANDKLIDRTLVASTVSNPFLNQNNYINDLKMQEQFLRPQRNNSV